MATSLGYYVVPENSNTPLSEGILHWNPHPSENFSLPSHNFPLTGGPGFKSRSHNLPDLFPVALFSNLRQHFVNC